MVRPIQGKRRSVCFYDARLCHRVLEVERSDKILGLRRVIRSEKDHHLIGVIGRVKDTRIG